MIPNDNFYFPLTGSFNFLITDRSLEAANIHYLTDETLIAVIKNRELLHIGDIIFPRLINHPMNAENHAAQSPAVMFYLKGVTNLNMLATQYRFNNF